MLRIPALLLAALLLGGVPACGDDGDDDVSADDATTAPAEASIAGRTFEATSLDSDVVSLVEGVPLQISFTDDEITVDAGCNRFSGTYAVEGPILVVEDLAGTEIGCEPELMEQDAWISGVLSARPVITPQMPDRLLLSDDGWTLTLVATDADADASPADVDLVGPRWSADTIIDDDGARSVPSGVTATITFADDGTYQVSAGCNTGSGTYSEAGAGTYQIDAPSLTRRRCGEEAMEVEAVVVDMLDGEVTASIEADRLTLIASSGAGLSFTAPA